MKVTLFRSLMQSGQFGARQLTCAAVLSLLAGMALAQGEAMGFPGMCFQTAPAGILEEQMSLQPGVEVDLGGIQSLQATSEDLNQTMEPTAAGDSQENVDDFWPMP